VPREGGCLRCGIHWWVEDAERVAGGWRFVLGGHDAAGGALTPALQGEIGRLLVGRLAELDRAPVSSSGVGRREGRRRRRHRGVV
jgi:hypothetical protein